VYKLVVFISVLLAFQAGASESNAIESFSTKGELVNVMSPCDPGCYVEIAIGDGVIISSPTAGVDWEKLYSLEKLPNKATTLMYSVDEGAYAVHEQSGTKIYLTGSMDPHPIDIGLKQCLSSPEGQTTMGINVCLGYAFEAWGSELDRVYVKLGGPENPELEAAQSAWKQYRDAQFNWIYAAFGDRQGSKWSYGIQDRKIRLITDRIEQLQSFYKGY
jgi:uncharacterized protein YecT (DUF1311 family)